jgi:hypothetical protein
MADKKPKAKKNPKLTIGRPIKVRLSATKKNILVKLNIDYTSTPGFYKVVTSSGPT